MTSRSDSLPDSLPNFEHPSIRIRGAREHNLKDITVVMPRDRLVVITGLSGSGKSSLAFDTLYAEGQRRYVESLSAYARQFLELMKKPDVDSIDGLSPAISIEQKTTSKNPRSTVGTVTEIHDYLRLLFARIGVPHSPATGLPIEAQTVSQMVDRLMQLPQGSRWLLLSPLVRGRKGEYKKELLDLRKRGFQRVKVDGTLYDIDQVPPLNKKVTHTIEVVVDRIVIQNEIQNRLADSLETALQLSDGLVNVENAENKETLLFSARYACPVSGFTLSEIEPRLFSYNSPYGACPTCDGLGVEFYFEREMESFQTKNVCPTCQGYRLNPKALCVKIGGQHIGEINLLSLGELGTWFETLELPTKERTIAERILKEIQSRLRFLIDVGLDYLTLSRTSGTLSGGESQRIRLASQVGSGLVGVLYVLDEPSIGLHQKDNDRLLASLKKLRDLGNTVVVVEHDSDAILTADHVIDMGPGAGIHGGTIVAQGSPQDILDCPDSLTGAYLSGKKEIPLFFQGHSERRVPDPERALVLRGASANNLKNLTVSFPLGTFTCITGVSGGGKSSLIIETLYKALAQKVMGSFEKPGPFDSLDGLSFIDKVIDIDQSPIGRTPRSNPATYIGCFTVIRDWFASLPQSKARGYAPGRFSFNVKGGRCEACQGDGVIKIEMHFLPDVYVECDQCKGKRYNRETLEIKYRDKSIADVLEMTVEEGVEFFEAHPSILNKLKTLQQVGLGYVHIGQQATTLSGGEAQRVKLAKELSKRSTGKTIFILDEPTTGLHFQDIHKLLEVLHTLVNQGNTVLVIEHNLDVIKTADWIIDLGPEGGKKGGQIVAEGTPETVAQISQSPTGHYLNRIL